MIYSVKQTKLDRMVEDIKHLGMDKNPVGYYSTDFTKGHILTAHDLNSGEDVAIGTIKDFWPVELFSSAPELALEVKRLREQLDNVRDWVSGFEDEHMMSIFKIWIGEEDD
tara:strand:- start:533 stop:865 length:333 start_codon:yes stop_codon:yes gene_type:complete